MHRKIQLPVKRSVWINQQHLLVRADLPTGPTGKPLKSRGKIFCITDSLCVWVTAGWNRGLNGFRSVSITGLQRGKKRFPEATTIDYAQHLASPVFTATNRLQPWHKSFLSSQSQFKNKYPGVDPLRCKWKCAQVLITFPWKSTELVDWEPFHPPC